MKLASGLICRRFFLWLPRQQQAGGWAPRLARAGPAAAAFCKEETLPSWISCCKPWRWPFGETPLLCCETRSCKRRQQASQIRDPSWRGSLVGAGDWKATKRMLWTASTLLPGRPVGLTEQVVRGSDRTSRFRIASASTSSFTAPLPMEERGAAMQHWCHPVPESPEQVIRIHAPLRWTGPR